MVLGVEKEARTQMCSPSRAVPTSSKRSGSEEPSGRQSRASGTRTLPALCISTKDQNYKEAFDYWLLSVNDSHNYNDTKDSMWSPIKTTGIDFYILAQQ